MGGRYGMCDSPPTGAPVQGLLARSRTVFGFMVEGFACWSRRRRYPQPQDSE